LYCTYSVTFTYSFTASLNYRRSVLGRDNDEIFLFATVSRPALGPIQRVPGLLPRRWSGRGVKLTTHLHLIRKLRILGAISPLPHTPSCHGV